MKKTLMVGQTDVKIELELDYANGDQMDVDLLSKAQAIQIHYKYDNDETEGVWDAEYRIENSKPIISYQFNGESVPNAGWLQVQAQIVSGDGGLSLGQVAQIPIKPSL